MATRIRLARGGRKKRPFYRIVVADGRAPRDGKFIERIGSYDPLLAENKVSLDVERAKHWLNVGARPSHRVSKLLALQGVEHKLVVLPPPTPDDVKAEHAKAKAAKQAGAQPAAEKAPEQPKAEAKPEEAPQAEAKPEEAPKAEAKPEEAPQADAKPADEAPAAEAAGKEPDPADEAPKAEAKAADDAPAQDDAAAAEEPAS